MVKIVLFIVVVLIVGYSIIIHLRMPNKLWEWWNTLLATVISVLFAIVVGIYLIDYQHKISDEKRRQQYSEMLAAELSDNIKLLDSGRFTMVHFSTFTMKVLITYVQPLTIEDAIRSGLFDFNATTNLLSLAQLMHVYNTKVSFFSSLCAADYSNSNIQHNIVSVINDIEETRKEIIRIAQSYLKKKKSP